MPGTMEVLGLLEGCALRLPLSWVSCGRYRKKNLTGVFPLSLLYPTFLKKGMSFETLYVYVFIIIVIIVITALWLSF